MTTSTDRRRGVNSSAAIKVACIAGTTGNITLSGEQTIDGIALVTDDRCLVKNQTTASENGIYRVDTSSWKRAADWDGSYDVTEGTIVPVSRGTSNSDTMWRVSTTGTITVGTTSITFEAAGVNDSGTVSYLPAGSGAVSTTVQAKLRESVSVFDFMTAAEIADAQSGSPVLDHTAAIQAVEDYADTLGVPLVWGAGTFRCDGELSRKNTDWIGAGKTKTILDYRGNTIFIDANGTTGNRLTSTIFDMTIDGSNAGAAAQGISLGWNMRSIPLCRVLISNFGHYGIHFVDQNWICNFIDVSVVSCGITTNNSSGIFKDAAIDASTWNAITFNNLVVEFCGTSSSTAGGVHLLTTTVNRGVYFNNPMIEDNLGTEEVYIENIRDLQFKNFYMERTNVAGQSFGVALSNCHGGIHGGYITGAGANNLVGLRVSAESVLEINALDVTGWNTAGVQNYSSTIYTGKNPNTTYVNGDASAQWFGDYAPRVSAHKNGTNQTAIASGVFTKVTFGTERYDLTGAFASSTFTPQSIGTYQIDAQVDFTASADQDVLIISIYLNNAAYKSSYTQTSGTARGTVKISAQVDTSATTDFIDIYVRQTSGGSKDISGGADNTWFMASLIGRDS